MARYQVIYQKPSDRNTWHIVSDTYATFERACTIASALENRGFKTYIEETKED